MKYLPLLCIALFFFSCEKDVQETCNDGIKNQDEVAVDCGGPCTPCPITYPEIGDFGNNVLFGTDTLTTNEENSSLRAIIPQGSSLQIELELIHGDMWFYSDEQNWSVSTFTNDKQTFTNLNSGTSDLNLNDPDPMNTDTILIKYFENGDVESLRKLWIR